MVKATKGVLITCDPAVKQILIYLDEKSPTKFIIQDLDSTHVFVTSDPGTLEGMKEDLARELEKNNYVGEEG